MPRKAATLTKLFVLDTNVLMHDPTSLYRFEEHDVYVPIATLEELDQHKKGMNEVSRNARQASRFLDEIVSKLDSIEEGVPLAPHSHNAATGRLFLQTQAITGDIPLSLPTSKVDNQILGVVLFLSRHYPKRQVILVSKDINMRIKARALGLPAEDYFNDKVLEDTDLLYAGLRELPANFWDTHGKGMESWQANGQTYYRIKGPLVTSLLPNEFVFQEGPNPLYAKVLKVEGKQAEMVTVRDFSHHKNNVWGITSRNREQNFALNVLMDPEIDFVTLLGQAGTGKTLLTLAAGLAQVLDKKIYTEIIMTRVTVPVGEDIGFLPGTEEEKMTPWMGALEDNLDVLNKSDDDAGEWTRCHAGPDSFAHQGQVAELHARPHLSQQVPHHRRGAEPHAQADEDADHPRRPRHQGGVPGQYLPDRHALPHRRQFRPHLRGGPFQRLAAQRPCHLAAG